jgi:hypothetical protein
VPVVQNVATDPSGNPLVGAIVRIALIASTIGRSPGYLSTSDIVGSWSTTTDNTGKWSLTLTGNANITPSNTYYQVSEAGYISNIVVPASGGPYNLSSILVSSPPALSPPGITGVQVAANGSVAGSRPEINVVAGANVVVSAVDNPGTNSVDVTVTSTAGGAGPSDTVTSGTSYGLTPAAGTATTYSRGDHGHGTPALTSTAPSTSAVGDSAAVGAATTPARADHTHGREAFGAVTAQTSYGQSSGNGTASTVTRSDHTHGTPALGTTAGTAAAGNDSRIVGAAPAASPTLTGTATVNGRLALTPVVLTDAATIATDASLGNQFRVTLAGNRTLANPSNPVDGQRVIWELIQDATGTRTITLDTAFGLGTDITSVTLSTAANKRDYLGAIYDSGASKWHVIAFLRGY